ncbi:MAG TPA: radical SAM protein, partial [Spirochaetia bacterium]|nr:radical SAM protein [Spirochaetia bacterium]
MTTFKDRIMHPGEVERYLDSAGNDFIDDELIERQIAENRNPDPQRIRDILQKSRAIQTLEPAETAALLNVEDPELLEEMKRTAFEIKLHVYDNRIVTFAPLYVSNHCVNSCEYCGFRVENRDMIRRRLTMEEIAAETRALAGTYGHKRLVAVFGEHPSSHVDYIVDTINTIYDQIVPTRKGHASIRRVNVNAAPLGIEDLKRVKEAGIGTFQVFQETYHHDTYRKLHGS